MPLAQSFPPICDSRARVLILGSMPGVASLDAGQYYAHPRNTFWPIMGELFGADPGLPYDERCKALLATGVAVWDVLRQCVRKGSLDANIARGSEVANDLAELFASRLRIGHVMFNGQKAEQAFRRHVLRTLSPEVVDRLTLTRLPSTSPAHAGRTYEEKLAAWRDGFQQTDARRAD